MPAIFNHPLENKTRSASQHGKYPKISLRNGQKDGSSSENQDKESFTSHCSLVTFLSESMKEKSHLQTDLWSELTKKEVYKTVSDWFEIWHPWQQKHVLRGITERCSTNQLESLATTLEPVFHWEFMLFKAQSYPMMRVHLNMRPKHPPTFHKRSRSKQVSSASSSPLSVPGRKHRDGKKQKDQGTTGLVSIEEKIELRRQSDGQPEHSANSMSQIREHVWHEQRSKQERKMVIYAEELFDTAWSEAFDELFANTIHDEYEVAEYISSRIMADSMNNLVGRRRAEKASDRVIEDIVGISDALGNLISLSKVKSRHATADQSKSNITAAPKHDRQYELPVSRKGVRSRGASGTLPRSQRSSRSSVKLAQFVNQLYPDKVIPLSETTSFKDIIYTVLRRQIGRKQTLDPVDLVLSNNSTDRRFGTQHHNAFSRYSQARVSCGGDFSGSSSQDSQALKPLRLSEDGTPFTAKSDNFFDKNKPKKLGPVKAKMRTGVVKRPYQLQDIHVPLQRLCKNSQCFTSNAQAGRALIKPDRHILNNQFQKQTEKVWQWLSKWEDYEKACLLSEIIKKCNTESLSYLAQCLFDRLKERFVINWLPDQLLILIFSMLPWKDIITCSQVCKRWKYLCSTDELWMIKCFEYGQSEQVPDIIDRVIQASHEDQSIDWKMAFFDIQKITQCVKSMFSKSDPIASVIGNKNEMPTRTGSVHSSTIEITVKTLTAAQLAKESDRLKHGSHSSRTKREELQLEEEEEMWWSERESKSGFSSRSIEIGRSVKSSVTSLPAITDTEDRKSTITPTSSGQQGNVSNGAFMSAAQSERKVESRSSHLVHKNQIAVSTDKVTSVSSEAVQGYEKLETKAVMQWIRGRSKPGKDDGELALDVRPDLVQAEDILGKCKSTYVLQWRDEDRKTSKKFAGTVPGVKRVRKFHGHMDAVHCIEFTRRRLISGSMDGTIRLWDIKSGHSIHKLYGHKGAVTCLALENNVLYTGSWDMTIMVWDLIKFMRRTVMSGHQGTVSCLALNERFLFSGSHDNTVRVWSKATCLQFKVLRVHDSHVMGIYVSNNFLITGSSDRTIRVTDYYTGTSKVLVSNHPEPIHRMIVEGHLIITSSVMGRVYFWNKETGEAEAGIQAHSVVHAVNALAFHNGRFFTASADHTVKEWDLFTMTCVRYLHGHKAAINDFKISDKRMVSCSADGQIRVWDMDIGDKTSTAEVTDDILPSEIVNQRDLE